MKILRCIDFTAEEIPYEILAKFGLTHEMIDALALSLVDKRLMTDQIVLTVCYDVSCITAPGSERAPWALGTAICFLIALLFAGLGNSLKWDGTKSDEDNE